MPNFNFSQPPSLQGPEAAQLVQMHRFLFRLTEQLNAALSETDRRIENTDTTARYAAKTAESNAGTNQSVNDLRSLIIKTVDTVESEMDKLEYELKSNYIGKSEWGEYQEQIKSIASATAESTVDSYEFSSRLDSLDAAASGFEQYMTAANGYIKRGIIGYDEDNIPIFGVAIAQDLKSKTVVIDGETYEEIDTTKNLATFTAGKLSFWIDGVEMAYFSNSELVITRINVEDSITFDDVWKLSRKYGLTLEYLDTLVADALEGGEGLALGCRATVAKLLEVAWDIKSHGNVYGANIFPKGSLFLSVINENPEKWFGGTWELWSKGRVIVGVDPDDPNFSEPSMEGGEAMHALAIDELPAHKHGNPVTAAGSEPEYDFAYVSMLHSDSASTAKTQVATSTSSGRYAPTVTDTGDLNIASANTANAGGGQPHNNMQPFITCYIWLRTA